MITHEKNRISCANPGQFLNPVLRRFWDVFDYWPLTNPGLIECNIAKSWCAFITCPIVELIKKTAWALGSGGSGNPSYYCSRCNWFSEGVKCHSFHGKAFSKVRYYEWIAKIGLVRAVVQHRFTEWNSGEGWWGHFPFSKFFENAVQYWLDGTEYIFLGHKCHFHVQLVELARASVCSGIFIAEAWCYLEITVKTRNHN